MFDHYTRGSYAIVTAWLLVAVPLWIGFFQAKAAVRQWILSPIIAAAILFGAGIVVAILQESLKAGGVANAAIALICLPLAGYVGGEALVYVTRVYIHRPRPATANYPAPGAVPGVHESSYSFPSGHATGAAATLICLSGLAAVTWRTWWPWLIGIAAAIAVAASRLVLGVHWFSDVVFGLLAAIPWAIAATLVLAALPWPLTWPKERTKRQSAPT